MKMRDLLNRIKELEEQLPADAMNPDADAAAALDNPKSFSQSSEIGNGNMRKQTKSWTAQNGDQFSDETEYDSQEKPVAYSFRRG